MYPEVPLKFMHLFMMMEKERKPRTKSSVNGWEKKRSLERPQ